MADISTVTLPSGTTYDIKDAVARELIDSAVSENTKAGWAANPTYVPRAGEIVVYTDQTSVTVDGVTKVYPEIKIGDGSAYVADLPFVGGAGAASAQDISNHINDTIIHVTQAKRDFWDAKLNCGISGDTLVLNRL